MRYLCLLGTLLVSCSALERRPPLNVVVILVDDLGWSDTGIYGSTFYQTPDIDILAGKGMRWTEFYATSGVCSPTRASIMTGRHPARLQITNWIGGEQQGQLNQAPYQRQLPTEEVTIGEVFQDAGYVTAYIGKWHLGTEGFMPKDQGFHHTHAVNFAGQPGSFFAPYKNARFPASNVPDLADDPDSTYLTDRLTDAALSFLFTAQDDPFLLVLSHYAVHTPLQAKPHYAAWFEGTADDQAAATLASTPESPLPRWLNSPGPIRDTMSTGPAFRPDGTAYGMTRQRHDHAVYAAMIASVDESVGRINAALEHLGLVDHTIVVFTSDNGGLSTLSDGRRWAPTSNRPLRAGKGFLYEGGIRIPLMIRDPRGPRGKLITGSASTNDLLPTLAGLAGLEPPTGLDGMDLSRVIRHNVCRIPPDKLPGLRESDVPSECVNKEIALPKQTLYWHFPHYHGSGNRPSGAIRDGHYKLIEWLEDGSVELYDLRRDLSESTNLASELPEVAARLQADLHQWRADTQVQMPTPNPDY